MIRNPLSEKVFQIFDFKKTVMLGCIFGALGLVWFYLTGYWADPMGVETYEWIVFFVLCIASLICWILFSRK